MGVLDVLIRVSIAIAAGLVIGLERERRHQSAGLKTHMLVCLGACLVSLISVEMVYDIAGRTAQEPNLGDIFRSDFGRLGAQVISGVGFLGAGTILHTKGSVKGLTTAATLWFSACLGLAIGLGYHIISLVALSAAMLLLAALRILQRQVQKRRGLKVVRFRFVNKKATLEKINQYFIMKFITVKRIEFSEELDVQYNNMAVTECIFTLLLPRTLNIEKIVTDLHMDDNVVYVSEVDDEEDSED